MDRRGLQKGNLTESKLNSLSLTNPVVYTVAWPGILPSRQAHIRHSNNEEQLFGHKKLRNKPKSKWAGNFSSPGE